MHFDHNQLYFDEQQIKKFKKRILQAKEQLAREHIEFD